MAAQLEINLEYGCDFYVDPAGHYFAARESWIGYSYNGMSTGGLHIFTFNEEEREIYPFADVLKGYVNFEAEEISTISLNNELYVSPIVPYGELREKALKVLDGETLSENEMGKYFLEE